MRGVKPDEIDAIGDALVEAGVTVIEVPLNSPQPFESIKRLAARHGAHALIGAGTVLEAADVARVKEAGGQLIVAPNFDADVVRAAKAAGLAALPGVMTPSEGFAALKAGADGLKLFPAEIIPPAVFKAWRAVFPPETLLLAVGGSAWTTSEATRRPARPGTASARRSTSRAVRRRKSASSPRRWSRPCPDNVRMLDLGSWMIFRIPFRTRRPAHDAIDEAHVATSGRANPQDAHRVSAR